MENKGVDRTSDREPTGGYWGEQEGASKGMALAIKRAETVFHFFETRELVPNTPTFSKALKVLTGCVVSALLLSSCSDENGDPLAVPVAQETRAAVGFSAGLPTVPHLLSDNGMAPDGIVESEAWWASWNLPRAEGSSLRSQVHASAASRLVPVMGVEGVRQVLEQNAANLNAAEVMGFLPGSESISEALNQARSTLSEGYRSLREGEGERALIQAFRTADLLWTVSPPQVALELIRKANDVLRRNSQLVSYSQEELIRIRRLTHGASEALDEGDYPRAIRRAYYACQLLGVDLS